MGKAIGQVSDPESCCRGGDQSSAVVSFEPPPRTNRYYLVAIHELPGFGALHEGLMSDELLRRFGRPMRLDVVRARDELPIYGADASCDQVGVLKIAYPYRTIVTLCDEIDEAITVAGVDLQPGMASRHFREDGSEVALSERKRHGNPQASAKVTCGQDRFLGHVDLGADACCIVSESGPGFCESSPAGRSSKQLDAKFRFKPEKPTTDNRLGNAEPERGGRNAPGISNFYECP